jgi:transposase
MLRRHRAGEDLTPRPGGGPQPLRQDPERARLRSAVAKQPDVTLAEVQGRLAAHGSRTVSEPTICRALQQLQLPRKKKVSAPRSETESNGRNFASW